MIINTVLLLPALMPPYSADPGLFSSKTGGLDERLLVDIPHIRKLPGAPGQPPPIAWQLGP